MSLNRRFAIWTIIVIALIGVAMIGVTMIAIVNSCFVLVEKEGDFTIRMPPPVVVTTILLWWAFRLNKPTLLRVFTIPIGIAGGFIGTIIWPTGFIVLMAFSNPYIPGAREAIYKVPVVLSLAISLGITVSIVLTIFFFDPMAQKLIDHQDENNTTVG